MRRTLARSFSAELMDIFRIENSVADLHEQVDNRSVPLFPPIPLAIRIPTNPRTGNNSSTPKPRSSKPWKRAFAKWSNDSSKGDQHNTTVRTATSTNA